MYLEAALATKLESLAQLSRVSLHEPMYFACETPINLAMSEGFRSHELTKVRALVIEHRGFFLEKWNEHFGG